MLKSVKMITRGQFIEFSERGKEIRSSAKELVFDLMTASPLCQSGGAGMKQAEIFRECGLDHGDYPSATSSNQ